MGFERLSLYQEVKNHDMFYGVPGCSGVEC